MPRKAASKSPQKAAPAPAPPPAVKVDDEADANESEPASEPVEKPTKPEVEPTPSAVQPDSEATNGEPETSADADGAVGDGEAAEKSAVKGNEPFEPSDDYQKLIDLGFPVSVARDLDRIYQNGLLVHSELDQRALDTLKEFQELEAADVLKSFCDGNLEHVANKSAYLMGVMRTHRQRLRMVGAVRPGFDPIKGPDEDKIKELLKETGYSLEVTTGQRKYGGPPPDWEGRNPAAGHEIFVGKIPKDIYEDKLVPLFSKIGKIWDLRLMMDPITNTTRGYCFITFCEKEHATKASQEMDDYEIVPRKRIKVNVSVANVRLFVANIPKDKCKRDIMEEFTKVTEGLTDAIVYASADDPSKKNRGFAFLEFESHKAASSARRKLQNGKTRIWNSEIIVDWADPLDEPDQETMSKVKVVYVRNLTSDVTEETLKEAFGKFGTIERVKRVTPKDYAFIHFEERDAALKSIEELNGTKIGLNEIEASLAKPMSEARKRHIREQRGFGRGGPYGGGRGGPVGGYGGCEDYWPPGPPMRGRGMRGRPMMGHDYYGSGYADPYAEDSYGFDTWDYGPPAYGYPPHGALRGTRPFPMRRGFRGGPRMRPSFRGDASGFRGGASRGAAGTPLAGKRKLEAGPGGAGGAGGGGIQKKRGFSGGAGGGAGAAAAAATWASQPIPQQPLGAPAAQSYRASSEFYTDSYSSQW